MRKINNVRRGERRMDSAEGASGGFVRLLVVVDQWRAVCSSSYSLTCTTCEAGLQRMTPSQLLSLINFKQTQRPDTAIHALNSKINAYFHQVSIMEEKRWQEGARAEQKGELNTTL